MFEDIHLYFEKKNDRPYKVLEDSQLPIDICLDKENSMFLEQPCSIENQIKDSLKKNIFCDPDFKSANDKNTIECYFEHFIANSDKEFKKEIKSGETVFDSILRNIDLKNKKLDRDKNEIVSKSEENENEKNKNSSCEKCLRNNYGICICEKEVKENREKTIKIIECEDCFTDYCEICYAICHKNCLQTRRVLRPFMVYESSSCCRCIHHYEENKIFRLECFYSNFFYKNFRLEDENMIYKCKKDGLLICNLCANDHYAKEDLEELKEGKTNFSNFICECNHKSHNYFNTFDLFIWLEKTFRKIQEELEYSSLIKNFKDCLNDYIETAYKLYSKDPKTSDGLPKDINILMADLKIKKYYRDLKHFIDYEVRKFSIYNIIYNGNLKLRARDEIELLEDLIGNTDYEDFKYEKINLYLTFVFYFYRKHFFLCIDPVTEEDIYLMPIEIRLRNLKKNKTFYDKLKEFKIEKDLFSIKIIISIFDKIKLKNFIIFTPNNEHILFSSYFLMNISYCYCYSNEEIEEISYGFYKLFLNGKNTINNKYVTKIDYIDIFFFNDTDSYIFEELNEIENINDNETNEYFANYIEKFKYRLKYSNLRELFFEYENKNYSEHLFKNEKIFHLCLFNKRLSLINLLNLNCLKIFGNFKKISELLSELEIPEIETPLYRQIKFSLDENYYNSYFDRNNFGDFVIFKENKIEKYFDKILSESLPSITYNQLNNLENYNMFLEYLFSSIRKKLKKNTNSNLTYKINDLNDSLDLESINLSKYKEELKYLFLKYVFEYKKSDFIKMLKNWNLLLVLFLSNSRNLKFILIDLKFMNFLTSNYLLIKDSKNIDEEKVKIKDFTWKFLYMAYKFVLKHEKEIQFEKLKLDKQLYLLLEISCIDKEEDKLNNTFLFYFLKIFMKMCKLDIFRLYSPFEYNTKRLSSYIHIIIKFFFEKKFDYENYMNSFILFNCFDEKYTTHKKIKHNSENEKDSIDDLNNLFLKEKNRVYFEFSESNSNLNDKMSFVIIGKENIKLLLMEIIGNVKTADKTEFNLYFKILEKNFRNLEKIFIYNNDKISEYPHFGKNLKKLKLKIIRFLVNFLTLKKISLNNLNIIDDINLKYNELIEIAKSDLKNNSITEIDFINYGLESKFLIYKIKISIFEFIKIYFPTIETEYEEKLFNLYKIMKTIYLIVEEFNFESFKLIHFNNEKKHSFNSQNIIEKNSYENISFYLTNNIEKIYEKNIELLNKAKILENNFLKDEYTDSQILSKFYYNNYKKYNSISKHMINFLNENEKNFIHLKKYEDLKFSLWGCHFPYSDNIISILFLNIFNVLKDLKKFEKSNSLEKNLDEILNEDVLKKINMLNILLYYYSFKFSDKLLDCIDSQNLKILLKILTKINYYLIGIFGIVDVNTFYSLSQAIFVLFDFLILLNEHSFSFNLDKFFFQDLELVEDKNNLNIEIDNCEDNKIIIHDQINKNNFYYHCFIQLKNIINLLKNKHYKYLLSSNIPFNYLIIHFLHLIRLLKECLEVDIIDKSKPILLIINYCFDNIFDFEWIDICNISNENNSYIITFELLNLLNTYFEEQQDHLSEEFWSKIWNNLNYILIYKAIVKCLDLAIEEIKKNDNNYVKSEISFDNLKYLYLQDEKLHDNKYFELAEQFYKTQKLIYENTYFNDIIYDKTLAEYISNQLFFLIIDIEMKNKLKKKFIVYLQFLFFIGTQIEIKFKDSFGKYKFRTVYFFKSPRSFWLDDSIKNKFLEKAPRNSLIEKLDHFNKKFDFLIMMLNFRYINKFSYSNIFIRYLHILINYLDIFNFTLELFINLFLLIYIYENKNIPLEDDLNSQIYFQSNSNPIKEKFKIIFSIICSVSALQIISLCLWYYKNFKIKILKYKYKYDYNFYLFEEKKEEKKEEKNLFREYNYMRTTFNYLENHRLKNFIPRFENFEVKIKVIWIMFKNFFWNKEIKFIIFSLLCNLLFLITEYTLLLVFPILSIIRLYPLFGYFLKAILRKYKEFLALLIFIYVIEYIFSWITFLHFQENMISEYQIRTGNLNDESKRELLCSTALECFLNYLDLGLRLGGGMGDSNPRISYKFDTKNNYFNKLFWDILFHILVNLILSNIFFGVIVDTFNELRSLEDVKNNDNANKCFMCHKDRYDIVFLNKNFENHRKYEHGIFNYVYFIPYLLKKNPEVYSRAEKFAMEQILCKNIDWLPFEKEDSEEKKNDNSN